MNRHDRRAQARAQRATWTVFGDAVAETLGFQTPLHRAALKAAKTGAEEDGARFHEMVTNLPDEDLERLHDRLFALDAKSHQVARTYADSGRV